MSGGDLRGDYRSRLNSSRRTVTDARNYKCPECGGEFNTWEKDISRSKVCPFCGLEKKQYDPEEEGESASEDEVKLLYPQEIDCLESVEIGGDADGFYLDLVKEDEPGGARIRLSSRERGAVRSKFEVEDCTSEGGRK